MSEPLNVTFLWHMHQPYYRDPIGGEYSLPWVYLHGVKDYYDMAAIVDAVPGTRVVFNLVPSLLEQLSDYAAGTAVDPFLIRGGMAPADMGEEERHFVLEHFFSANRQRMIDPYPRYRQLLALAGDGSPERQERFRHFRDQDILDLQVWFFLAWTGEAARRRYPELQQLVRKGRLFTGEDKSLLFARHREILQEIIPLYRRLHGEGKAELAVSPYFHPILPLLCDMNSAHLAMPKAMLPARCFRHPEDARSQVHNGIDYFREIFGFAPAGMWPSEGAVSDEAAAVIAGSGLAWAASDEGVLARGPIGGLGPGKEALYQPYTFIREGRELALFFRDHALSDLIGFTYSQWDAERAVRDFVGRLQDIRDHVPGSRVVPIILDGENAWEYYADNGYHFLRQLYEALTSTPGLQLATFSDVLSRIPERRVLHHLHPGSWINADFGIWVGHPEENSAWELLAQAREAAVAHNPHAACLLAGDVPADGDESADETARRICASLYAAEGSDWFWWYGDDHFSPSSDRFDELFRRHLMNVYRLLGLDTPPELFIPIKKKSPAGFVREPAALITPIVNGLVTDYFEWLAAGLYDLTKQSSAMHAAETLLHSFYYGFDRRALYFRIDGGVPLDKAMRQNDRLALHLILDREYRLAMDLHSDGGPLQVKKDGEWRDTGAPCRWKIVRVCEAEIPIDAVSPQRGGRMFAYLTLAGDGVERGRWPSAAPMPLTYAGPELELENWLI